jgi:hypothetical protein
VELQAGTDLRASAGTKPPGSRCEVTSVNARVALDRYDKILIVLFVISLPLVNPWVRGDGVGYYAYARALVVSHNLRFEPDWLNANPSFRNGRVDAEGHIRAGEYTATGHLDNHFAIGPAMIWMPFLEAAHIMVLAVDRAAGTRIPSNGFSWPYLDTMAVVTALAGFGGLFISFRLARKYFPERWAFLATLGIGLASSLPVYMYFNPSWSHAQSAFVVALFLWYWDRTYGARTLRQWFVLGLMGGLMMDMYYPNTLFLFVVAVEIGIALIKWTRRKAPRMAASANRTLGTYTLFAAALILAFLPTLVTRRIIYGSFFATGYTETVSWNFRNPVWGQVLFSSDHGLFSWTPILFLACCGLFFLWRTNRELGAALVISTVAFYILIATYPDWDGISSYGNRFFVSLTPVFVVGLTALLTLYEKTWRSKKAAVSSAVTVLALLVVWNFGLIFQWGMHLIPDRGPISWSEVASNQFRVVPVNISESITHYFTGRHEMMQSIEKKDLNQLGVGNPSQEAPSAKK